LSVLAAVVVCGSLVGCGSAPLVAPTAYSEYNAKDGTFACDYPDGWSADGGGKNGPLWATFASGPAEIRIDADLAGSLLGSIASSATPDEMEEAAAEFEPVHQVHESGKKAGEQKYSGYKEVGLPQVLTVSLGPARKSEFTAASTFGSGLHGYRATVLARDKRVVVYAVCPEADWKTLQLGFDHVLSTLRRGDAQ
jgi:hypothetical protein